LVERVAQRDVTVLIVGESGTGKELVAQAIVRASARSDGPYVQFNCAALPRELAEAELFGHQRGAFTGAATARVGLFREADGGTLLLDEIGELEPVTQGKLLRALQQREVRPLGADRPVRVDVRIVAATNRDLSAAVGSGGFREDLFYRLDVVQIQVPPLRERSEDIVPLAQHFAERFAHRYGLGPPQLSPELLANLQDASWPGNVRQLENTIERLLALADGPNIGVEALTGLDEAPSKPSPRTAAALSLRERVAMFERGLVLNELERCHGNQSAAARRLGISRPTLIDKLKKYGLR